VQINRKVKPLSTIRTDTIFVQAEAYRQKLNDYYRAISNIYINAARSGDEITDDFGVLVHHALGQLLAAGERVEGMADIRKPGVIYPVKAKEVIEYISITISYTYRRVVQCGFKLAGRFGNKGVVSCIKPDNEMPVDAEGFRADIIIDPVSVFNRMNPGQWFEQFINRGNELLKRRVTEVVNSTGDYEQAWKMMIEWANDINPNYANLLENTHNTPMLHRDLVNDTIKQGFFMQISPFQDNIDQDLILRLSDKYNIHASPVSYVVTDCDGNKRQVVTKEPVLIGEMYTFLLYKIPHLRACGIGYINNFRTPVKSKDKINTLSPYPIAAIRFGEDEMRNLVATAGGATTARIIGTYANNKEAVDKLAWMLLTSPNPARIQDIGMSIREIVKGNNIVNVTKHMFSCFGIDIAPDDGA
jgi:hypothetical protein